MTTSREVRLAGRPIGVPTEDDFELAEVDVAAPADGQVLVRNLAMSVDPYMRGRMIERKSYVPPFQLGEALQGHAVGQVVESNHAGFAAGDHVSSMFGWREAFVAPGEMLTNLGAIQAPPSAYVGVLGMPGQTAYVGLLEVGKLKAGDTLFVSGAAGAVGSAVGQIAKIKGATVIGSAGSAEKVQWLTDVGFDAAFNYKDAPVRQSLGDAAPTGIDVYFDNVGGDHLEAALDCMKPFGRIALCGAIARYNDTEPTPGPPNLSNAIGLGLTLRGFIVSHFAEMAQQIREDMEAWVSGGQLQYRETVMTGIDQAPAAFIGLFTGANTGKMVVDVSG
jgi:NADPH-dependent curcumin reductase CurA